MIAFSDFMHALDRPEPYPWQKRLAARLVAGEAPAVIAVPTGAGKTTTVEALVWALGVQADRPPIGRTVGVRVVWAIDRRILVDEVHERARALADRLAAAAAAPEDRLHEIALALATLSATGVPLAATRWRGGVSDEQMLLGPLQPQVITSTVAQIGSRLLFRGYGVAEGSRALEAGLAACDTTICLDEAHLAEPFRQTVAAIRARRAADRSPVAVPSLQVVTLTATPQADEPEEEIVRLGDDDWEVPELRRRLTGEKRARLVEPPEDAVERDRVATLVAETVALLDGGADPVACVVNTVRRARAAFTALRAELPADEVDVALLIGPQRPADRDALLAAHRAKLFDGTPDGRPLVVVATQTFEVGLDADVAALVTESASATALVQRLGRLNRRGERAGRTTIVRDPDSWLYADDEAAAWSWLAGLPVDGEGTIDASVAALDGSWPASTRIVNAPTLTDDVVGLLAQTSPRPGPWQEPDVDAFLRGVETDPAVDVAVCWRADLRPDVVGSEGDGYRELLLAAAPPHPQELLTLSLSGARALLAARYPGDRSAAPAIKVAAADADVEGAAPASAIPDTSSSDPEAVRYVVIRRGEVAAGVEPAGLEPGDVVVLPTCAGGCDEHGLDPTARTANDVAPDLRPGERLAPVRITPEALGAALGRGMHPRDWERVAESCRVAEKKAVEKRCGAAARQASLAKLVGELADLLPDHPGLAQLRRMADDGAGPRLVLRVAGPTDGEHVLAGEEVDELMEDDEDEAPAGEEPGEEPEREDEEEDEPAAAEDAEAPRPLERVWVLVPVPTRRRERDDRRLSDADPPPTLDAHARAVHDRLGGFLARLKLPEPLPGTLRLAARVHDHGKADPRIQAFFHRGVRPLGAVPIAKSEFGTDDLATSLAARRRAGLPSRLDHEVASVAVLASWLARAEPDDAIDPALALHLVGVHHGRGRPVPRTPVLHGATVAAVPFHADAAGVAGDALGDGVDGWQDGAWLRRFADVQTRYGAWDVAYLAALLMLADRLVSSEGG